MADYVVRMTGQDNLSGTIKQVKSELNDLGKTTSKLDQIDAKFSKITNSTAPLKKQLRDLKTLMAQMNMDGLANTEQYTKIAQEAGRIKDAMDDAASATKRFSSDTANLDAGVQALQGIVAVGGVATGVMAMFGVENEKVQQAILKVQGALTVLNGVQQISNVLNKDSALIQTLKAARMKIATAAQVSQTTATKAGTLAQLKLNAAVLANPYVVAAAAIAALAAGIIYWVSTMDDATEAEKGLEEAIKVANNATSKGYETYMKNRMELDQLKTTLDNFNGSKEEERSLVDDLNNKYGNTLGKYKDLASWKKALANVSEYQCKLMAAEAKLAALNAEAYSAWAKAMSGENFEENMAKFKKLKEFADDALDDVNFYKKQVSIAINLSGGTRGSGSKGSGKSGSGRSTKTPKTGGSGSGSTQQEETGILAQLNNQLKEKQKLLDDENTSLIKQQQLLKEIADLQTRITRIQNARTAATDGTLADALKPQPLELTPEIDEKKLNESIGKLMARINAITGGTHFEIMQKQIEENNAKMDAWGNTATAIGQNFSVLGDIFSAVGDNAAAGMMQIAASTTQAVAQIIPQIMALIGVKEGQALAEGTASAAGLPFPANIAAIAAIVASVLSVIATIASVAGKFAGGGVVGGGSYYGDMVMARVNAGEMILNRKQQSNLFRAIESGDIGAGHTVLVPEFKIKGSDLYGTLRNFSKSVGKTGKVTGIR